MQKKKKKHMLLYRYTHANQTQLIREHEKYSTKYTEAVGEAGLYSRILTMMGRGDTECRG